MVARLTDAPLKLTQENHPENAPLVPEETQPTVTLASTVGIGALCSLVGMTIGSAGFSTLQQTGTLWELVCMIPLIATLCCLMGGWMGAFFHMIRADSQKKH